jgi:hypothetical protein
LKSLKETVDHKKQTLQNYNLITQGLTIFVSLFMLARLS